MNCCVPPVSTDALAGETVIVVRTGGAVTVTLAVPLQLTGHWIVIAWAVESLLLIEIGLRYEKPGFRLTGFGLLALVQLLPHTSKDLRKIF